MLPILVKVISFTQRISFIVCISCFLFICW